MEKVFEYLENNKEKNLQELFDFLKIPSISSQQSHKNDIHTAAEWVVENLKKSGIENARVIPTEGHPLVYAEWLGAGASAKTVLVYGHYDVQPVDPLNLWDNPPFEPIIKNGKIYARGSADDKGQVFTHIKSAEAYLKTENKLPLNLKFIIEGEEEAAESHIEDFIEQNPELLKCDAVLISDTEWFKAGMPSICYALRGLAYFEIEVEGPNRDLHSGSYGGAIDNPIQVLSWMITQLKDRYGRITIPHFYDDVLKLSEDEEANFKKLPFDIDAYKKDLGVRELDGEVGFSTLEKIWTRPTLDCNGIWGGYTGEGTKTVIPSKAWAKFSCRLVPNQNAGKIINLVLEHITKLAPPTVKVRIKSLSGANPVRIDPNNGAIRSAIEALKNAFGNEVVFMREGGSIPVVEKFTQVLNAPVVLMGFGLPDDNIHSPNESFAVENYFGGIRASAEFYNEFSKI